MYFMLDNYDSFVYNLASYFEELGQCVIVKQPNELKTQDLLNENIEGIILSPGPGHPACSKTNLEIIDKCKDKKPILGVCLGHQAIGFYFGATIKKGKRPMHGKITTISSVGLGLFQDIPYDFKVTRYHSLIVDHNNLPSCLSATAFADDGVLMAISHKQYPIYGIQFHPEAVLTEHGYDLIENYIKLCREWRKDHERDY